MVSVILPVYNGEKYLREAVDSILNQTFKEFELLILNDGSTDSTEEIIKSYSDERIRYFNLEHRGLPSTLNFGLLKAKYDYVARMDADDICHPKRFEKQMDFLVNNPSVDILGTNILRIYEGKKLKEKIRLPEKNTFIKNQLSSKCCIAHPTIMFKKELILSVGGYNLNEKVEDWELYLRLIKNATFHNLQECLLTLRVHGNNLSNISKNISFKNAEEDLAKKYYLDKIKENISQKNKAKTTFDLGYFYYLRDDERFKEFFLQAILLHRTKFKYIYFFVVGNYLRSIVLLFRKYGLIKLLNPLRKLDRNNILFRSDF